MRRIDAAPARVESMCERQAEQLRELLEMSRGVRAHCLEASRRAAFVLARAQAALNRSAYGNRLRGLERAS
jgi:hypothetical protein